MKDIKIFLKKKKKKSNNMFEYDETRVIFNFLTLINNSVTIVLSFAIIIIKKKITFLVFYLDCMLQGFCKYHTYYLCIQ